MDVKSNVTKSKSSSVAPKAESRNKKSKSNAEFQPMVVKKRGVYVENKLPNSLSNHETAEIEPKQKAPPRPRPGQKRFLASVLTILSKSSAATQYPDVQDITEERKNLNPQKIKKERRPQKKKFKSRVLNEEMLRNEQDELVVLKSGKEITQTPSTHSARSQNKSDRFKLTEQAHTSNRTSIRDILENNIYSGVAEGVAKEILEDKNIKQRPLRINDDPETLASAIAEKDDKKMYNFFVDLLKTTFSVYNVNADYKQSQEIKESKTELAPKMYNFEANDVITKKLAIKDVAPDVFMSRSDHFTIDDIHDDFLDYNTNTLLDLQPTENVRRKIRTRSFIQPNKPKPLPKSYSVNSKKVSRQEQHRIKKNRFINDLKQQLVNDEFFVDEPKNIFEALKVLVKNKKQYADSAYFYETPKISNEIENKDCVFRNRKIISPAKMKKNGKKRKLPSMTSTDSEYMIEDVIKPLHNDASYHSLEVHAYGYEDNLMKRQIQNRQKQIIYTQNTSTSNFNLNTLTTLIHSDSSVGTNYSDAY